MGEAELGEMMKVEQAPMELHSEFDFVIFNQSESIRVIKIQCPGVAHPAITINIIFNGCVVRIVREASVGVRAFEWKQKFQFRPSEGLFEFKEDQAQLDQGYLVLVLRAYDYQDRLFRFPEHFSMTSVDGDRMWDYPEDSCTASGADPAVCLPPISAHDAALGRLESANQGAACVEMLTNSFEYISEPIASPIGIDGTSCSASYE